MVSEGFLTLGNELSKSSKDDGGARDGALAESDCPDESRSFGHVEEGESNLFVMGVVDYFVDMEIKLDSVQPLEELYVGVIKGFGGSNMEFGGFQEGYGVCRRWVLRERVQWWGWWKVEWKAR
jgi:hypothetical protein